MRLLLAGLAATFLVSGANAQRHIPNPHIDYAGFAELTGELTTRRIARRVTEREFVRLLGAENTVVLDTRSAAKFAELHVKGAVHLNFSDITEESLAAVIPSRDTRVLIYCNNNFENAPVPFPLKRSVAALNIPTFVTLHAYGYENVYELGPAVDPADSIIEFEGNGARWYTR